MFEVPGSDVKAVHIDDECVNGSAMPTYVRHPSTISTESPSDSPSDDSSSGAAGSPSDEEDTKVRVQQ